MNSSANTTAAVSTGFPYVSLAFQRLCWKEARQIAPLAIALLAINTALHLLPLSSSEAELQGLHILLLNLMPCLFASGAGALLVSQEKEQRTIGWLSSLPIAPSQILRAKLFVGFAGLAIIWLACLLTSLIFDRGIPREIAFPRDAGFSVLLTAINSVFLLFLGVATAWRWQSTLVALVMIVPLATLVTVAVLILQGLSPENRLPDFLIGIFYLLFSGASLWYGWRSGQAFLTSKPPWSVWQNFSKKIERRGSRGNLLSAQPQGLASTLLWQYSVQNRMLPIAVVAIFVLPVLVILLRSSRDNAAMVAIPAWLIASWLGASVFQSDTVHQRIKFLAERGVSPRTIWWTRQILPFGLIAIATAISALLVPSILNGSELNGQNRPSNLMFPLMLIGIPAILFAHAAAQWLGQLIRSSIVSLIVAPAITLGAIGYLGFAIMTLGAPYWMMLAPTLVAFIATRVMTEPWMDGRTGRKYWLRHGAFLLAALAIPALPLLMTAMTYLTYQGMPSGEYQRIVAELIKHGRIENLIELVVIPTKVVEPEIALSETASMEGMSGMDIGDDNINSIDASKTATTDVVSTEVNPGLVDTSATTIVAEPETEQPVLGFVEQIHRNIESIQEQLAQRSGAVTWSRAVSFLAAEAVLTRAQLDIEQTNEQSKARYRTAMRIMQVVVTRMRLSWRLIDQEGADRIERWMAEQVQRKDAREMLGESNWVAITKTLADKEGRMTARRRSIVQSWTISLARSTQKQLELGDMPMAFTTGLAGWRGTIAGHRRVSRVSWLLLEYLESKDQSEADMRFAEVASAWGLPANRNRQSGLSLETGFQVPGQNWFGDWEDNR